MTANWHYKSRAKRREQLQLRIEADNASRCSGPAIRISGRAAPLLARIKPAQARDAMLGDDRIGEVRC